MPTFNEQAPDWVVTETADHVKAIAAADDIGTYMIHMTELDGLAVIEDRAGRWHSRDGILATMASMRKLFGKPLQAAIDAKSPYSAANWATLTADQKAGRAPMPTFPTHSSKHEAA